VCLVANPFDSNVHVPQIQKSLEAVREHHERRLNRLEEMLDERKQSLEDHRSGRVLLKDEVSCVNVMVVGDG
jgi:hypothetical protein